MLHFIRNIAVIGLGGIGGWFVPPFLRLLHAERFGGPIALVDGDTFTPDNLARQHAGLADLGTPKAQAIAARAQQDFPGLNIRAIPEYVTSKNVARIVRENTLAVVGVDNHPARALVARHAGTLRDACVLSAGNEKYDGNAHVTLRRAGRDLTAPLLERHPEIAAAKAGDRETAGCEELVGQGETQLLATNVLAATALLAAFQVLWKPELLRAARGGPPAALPQEIYFDLRQQTMTAIPLHKS